MADYSLLFPQREYEIGFLCLSEIFLAAVHSYLSSSLFSLYFVLMTQLGTAE